MIHRLTNSFGKVYMTIYVDREEKWLRYIREGYQSENNIKTGMAVLTDTIRQTGLECVLGDLSLVVGPISYSQWTAIEWAPQASKAGLKHMALVVAPEAIAGVGLENFKNSQTHVETKVFFELEEAKRWLRQFCKVR